MSLPYLHRKSTMVQVLKFILSIIRPAERSGDRQVIVVSQDDYYRTKSERDALGIPSRMDERGIDPSGAENLRLLKNSYSLEPGKVNIRVPRFIKALDDRHVRMALVLCQPHHHCNVHS